MRGKIVLVIGMILIFINIVLVCMSFSIHDDRAQNLFLSQSDKKNKNVVHFKANWNIIYKEFLISDRKSFILSFLVSLISVTLGLVLGIVFAYFKPLQTYYQILYGVILSFPIYMLLVIFLRALGFERNLKFFVILMGVLLSARVLNHVFNLVKDIVTKDFIIAAKISGNNFFKIAIYYILPELYDIIILSWGWNMAITSILAMNFSYLGLGFSTQSITWGNMLRNLKSYSLFDFKPFLIIGIFIILILSGYIMVGSQSKELILLLKKVKQLSPKFSNNLKEK